MSSSSESVSSDLALPAVTSEQSVNTTVATSNGKEWKRWGGYTGIGAASLVTILSVYNVLQSSGNDPRHEQRDARAVAAKTASDTHKEMDVASTSDKSADIDATAGMTPEQCKEMAEKHWKNAQIAVTCTGIENKLGEMDKVLAGTDCTRADIGATTEAIQQMYVRLAREEWERANALTVTFFRVGALNEMRAALEKAGVGLEMIHVTDAMVQRLAPQRDKSNVGGE